MFYVGVYDGNVFDEENDYTAPIWCAVEPGKLEEFVDDISSRWSACNSEDETLDFIVRFSGGVPKSAEPDT